MMMNKGQPEARVPTILRASHGRQVNQRAQVLQKLLEESPVAQEEVVFESLPTNKNKKTKKKRKIKRKKEKKEKEGV
jgi:hypothetical protein